MSKEELDRKGQNGKLGDQLTIGSQWNFLIWGFNRAEAIQEAENYREIKFYRQSKNALIIFFVIVSLISIAFLGSEASGVLLYALPLPFVFFNHRWAIIVVCLMYVADKIYYISTQVGSPISHVIFAAIVVNLSARAFFVTSHLNVINRESNQAPEPGAYGMVRGDALDAEPAASPQVSAMGLKGERTNSLVVQHIIGLLAVCVGSAFLWRAAEFGHIDLPRSVGYVLGQSLVLGLIALLALAKWRSTISQVLIFGMVWFGSASYQSLELYEKATKGRVASAEMLTSVNASIDGRDVSRSKEGESEVAVIARNYLATVQAVSGDYTTALEGSGLFTALEPESVVDTATASISIAKINELRQQIPSFPQRVKDAAASAEQEFRSLDDQSAYRGFIKTKDEGVRHTEEYYQVQDEILGLVSEMLDLAIRAKRKNQLQLGNGQLLFSSDEMLKNYNELYDRLQLASAREAQLIADQASRMESKRDELAKIIAR